jgi:hypothetical protein
LELTNYKITSLDILILTVNRGLCLARRESQCLVNSVHFISNISSLYAS